MTQPRREHPYGTTLALLSSGDLPWRDAVFARLHLIRCRRCRSVVEQSRAIRDGMAEHRDALPSEVDWQMLSAEMKANIHLGLDVGAIVARGQGEVIPDRLAPEPAGWRVAVVLASLVVLASSGWYLNRFRPAVVPPSVPAFSAQTRAEGLELAGRGSAMTMLTPAADAVRTDSDWSGSLRARYVDSETGYVTVSQVYANAE